ncbi:unnamed protein product [Cylicocyclus nassatus]|uniref:TIL domain-containing protein n=1 Tax=Cylicocyclus nassatus TaxID=53992 RepID=A0AA36DML1_CYLNA|nr:unnamed protein product [Cylicocyclus nassatus]
MGVRLQIIFAVAFFISSTLAADCVGGGYGDQTCTNNPCPNGQRCQLDEVVCVRGPCVVTNFNNSSWPVRSCRPYRNCGVNEEWRDCAQFCEPSCASPAPLCPEICQPGKCQCREGYFRRNGICVSYTPGCGGITIQGPGG